MSEDAHSSDYNPEEDKKPEPEGGPKPAEPPKLSSPLFLACKGKGTMDDALVYTMSLEQHLSETIKTSGFMGLSQESLVVVQCIIASIANFFSVMQEKFQHLGFHIFGMLYASYLKHKVELVKERTELVRTGKHKDPQAFLDGCLFGIKLNDGWVEENQGSENQK